MSIAVLPEIYQLRIRFTAIGPLIWRRILVRNDTSIADLHAIIQIAFGWSDSHLHRFIIHGKSYGTPTSVGSPSQMIPSRHVSPIFTSA